MGWCEQAFFGSSTEMDEQARKAERIKALLSGYYGTPASGSGQHDQPASRDGVEQQQVRVQHASTASSLEAASLEARR